MGYRAYRAKANANVGEETKVGEEAKVEVEAKVEEDPFENKYFKEYDELQDDPDAPVPRAHSHVRETTPQGDVIMTYDADRAVFCYYCDKRSVQFKYLEPVARKYVIAHGCKRIYIDFRKELTKAFATAATAAAAAAAAATATATATAAAATATAAATAADKPQPPASIFARFKKQSNNNGVARNDDRVPALKDQITRYLYCGRLDEYDSGQAIETHDFNIIKPIDYASYKKITITA
jgi:pyruvate/2-oxoglutarate dehydrogenase complex dihydrolipoamide acyltransferase (E2) component